MCVASAQFRLQRGYALLPGSIFFIADESVALAYSRVRTSFRTAILHTALRFNLNPRLDISPTHAFASHVRRYAAPGCVPARLAAATEISPYDRNSGPRASARAARDISRRASQARL